MYCELVDVAEVSDCAKPAAPDGALVEAARNTIERLRALAGRAPCVVLLGERNSGKSTAVNTLIGSGLLPTNIIASTRYPTLLVHAPRPALTAVMADGRRRAVRDAAQLADETPVLLEVGLPVDRLKRFEVLDTPAGFAPDRIALLPGLPDQLVTVWCTLATQAWKASEKKAWLDMAPALRRNGVLTATAIDRVPGARDRDRLMARLGSAAGAHFRAVTVSGLTSDQDVADGDVIADVLERITSGLRDRRTRTIERLCGRITRLAGLGNDAARDATADATAEPIKVFVERTPMRTVAATSTLRQRTSAELAV